MDWQVTLRLVPEAETMRGEEINEVFCAPGSEVQWCRSVPKEHFKLVVCKMAVRLSAQVNSESVNQGQFWTS